MIGRRNSLAQKLEAEIITMESVHCHAHRLASGCCYTAADLYSVRKCESTSITSVRREVATVSWPSPQTLKIKNVQTVFGSVYCEYSAVHTKMFNFRRITLFCLEKRLSYHKMTIFATNLGEGIAPLALPWLRLCFGPPLGNFLRTPLTLMQVWRCFTVSPLRSTCLAMHQTTMTTKGRQLQHACRAR